MRKRNNDVQSLKTGDKIITDFFKGEELVIRKIVWIKDNPEMRSGREVMFDGGIDTCEFCHRPFGTPLDDHKRDKHGIDASWVIPVTP
jgi:hypothetical protein